MVNHFLSFRRNDVTEKSAVGVPNEVRDLIEFSPEGRDKDFSLALEIKN
jgi:hypothetical protein